MFLKQKLYTFDDAFPLNLNHIKNQQGSDQQLKKMNEKKIGNKIFRGADLTTYQDKVHVSENCREKLIDWHHDVLQHRGKESMTRTIGNDFKWPGWTTEVGRFVAGCELYQKHKITGVKNYGKVPVKGDAQTEPWEIMRVDLAGPWKTTFASVKGGNVIDVEMLTVTIVDEGTGFAEIWPIIPRDVDASD